MKRMITGLMLCSLLWSLLPAPAQALDAVPYDPTIVLADSPVIITGYAASGPTLGYVQLFNTSDQVVDISGWQLSYVVDGQTAPIVIAELDGLLRPHNYLLVSSADSEGQPVVTGADAVYHLDIPADLIAAITAISLTPSALYLPHDVVMKSGMADGYYARNISSSTGNFLSTFSQFDPTVTTTLYGGGLYDIPPVPGVQVSEVLPSPRSCSPFEMAPDCYEYIKLYNPTTTAIDLGQYRLRVGDPTATASPSNAYPLSFIIQPGHFALVSAADNPHVSLANSGGYVWLEDRYGLQRYDTTVQSYADASSAVYTGQAWAYNDQTGEWQWTPQPTPGDSPSVFPVATASPVVSGVSTLTPCQPGQERNPTTNRCRKIVTAASTLTPCAADQYRNPETNRCRSLATATSSTLTPCKAGQERNPTTNRCRAIAQTAVLGACAVGQERNPDTNRCRKVASTAVPEAAFAVEPVKQTGTAFAAWWALGGVGALAVGYAGWEWRAEAVAGLHRLAAFLLRRK